MAQARPFPGLRGQQTPLRSVRGRRGLRRCPRSGSRLCSYELRATHALPWKRAAVRHGPARFAEGTPVAWCEGTFAKSRAAAVDRPQSLCLPAGPSNEAYLPASQRSTRSHPWLPRADGHARRPQGHQEPSRQGPTPPFSEHLQEVTTSGAGMRDAPVPAAELMTLARSRRLRRRPDFVRIQGTGAKAQSRYFLLLCLPTSSSDGLTRLGVVASKRVGGAVERNRSKRLIREVFRLHYNDFPFGADVVVVARPGANELTFAQAEEQIRAALPVLSRRAGRPARPRDRF